MLGFGGIFILTGTLIIIMSIDVIHVPDENFGAPRWVVTAAGMAFALAGVMVALNAFKDFSGVDHRLIQWIYNALVIVLMISFATPFHWVAFGPGEREFNTTVGVGPVAVNKSGGELGGRLAFGFFAIVMDVLIIYSIDRMNFRKGSSLD